MTKPLSDSALIISSTVLSIGSLLFIFLLLISYFSKEKLLSLRNRMYKDMLIVNSILIVSEVIEVAVVLFSDNLVLLALIYRLHWSTGIIWFSILYYYSILFMDDIKSEKWGDFINHSKLIRRATIFFVVTLFIYLLLPFDVKAMQSMSYFPGIAAYFVYGFCAVNEAMTVIHLVKNRKRLTFRKRLAVWIMGVELITIFALQVTFPYIAFLAIGASVQMFFLYFNIENPDLFMIGELERVNSDIERSNRAKSDFLSNMSHEIRTPMNAIVGFSETLLNTTNNFDEKAARSDIKNIATAGNNLLDIVNNILDISKIESGKETLEPKEYSLGNVVTELSKIIEERLSEKPVKLLVEVDKTIPSTLYGDSTKLFQILLNILTNAVKYTEVGKIRLSITGEARGNMETLHIKISDTGYGIKKEDFDKLFEKFSRLENATENEIEGTGLGLVITKKYVDLMEGKIWFESEYEVGTTFYVDINQRIINKNEIGDITETTAEKKEDQLLDCSNYKVLLVDDNELNLKVASRLLSKYKFQIETVQTAKECIYRVKAENHYDMIFLDHMMPEMDGIEALHILRKLDGYELPPIVALTANAIAGMKEMYLREGFDEYLSKPINTNELERLIKKYFEK